jgi:EAL domain-containing protein (putative c-di-GMP-specific phosphodiesterase class I)
MAEQTGLILPLGEWILRAACVQARAWRDAGLAHLRVSVNISSRQFRQENLAALVLGALETAECDPDSLDLELPESVLREGLPESVSRMAEVRALGVRISLDHFGTGSSLNHLRFFPVDTLKIDQSLVKDITSGRDAAIASAWIALARSLKLGIVAEGVETDEQLTLLKRAECEQIQGNVFSGPLPAEEFEQVVRQPFPM